MFRMSVSFLLVLSLHSAKALGTKFDKPRQVIHQINACFYDAAKMGNPYSRDNFRVNCLSRKMNSIPLEKCIKFGGFMEYLTNQEKIRLQCIEIRQPLGIQTCIAAANKLEVNANRDLVLWNCLKVNQANLNRKSCFRLSTAMTLPWNKKNSDLYCHKNF